MRRTSRTSARRPVARYGADRVVSLALQMIEEGEDQLGREVSQRDGRRRLRTVRLDEIEEQDKRIPVGSHGAGTQGPLLGKVLGKERLDQRWEGRDGGGGVSLLMADSRRCNEALEALAGQTHQFGHGAQIPVGVR